MKISKKTKCREERMRKIKEVQQLYKQYQALGLGVYESIDLIMEKFGIFSRSTVYAYLKKNLKN